MYSYNLYYPLQPCFEAISGQLQQSIVTDCNAVASNQDAYDKLLRNLALVCAAKGKDPLDPVPCRKYNTVVVKNFVSLKTIQMIKKLKVRYQ